MKPITERPSIARQCLTRSTALAAAALALGLLFAAPASANKKTDTLGMAYDQAPESVDPYFNNVRIGVIIAANVWDTLLYRDPLTLSLIHISEPTRRTPI